MKAPLACILRSVSSTTTFCQRGDEENEFRFRDAECALKYDKRTNPQTPIVACAVCCDAARRSL